jgi:hypothetical protein
LPFQKRRLAVFKKLSEAPKAWSFAKRKFWCREAGGDLSLEQIERRFLKTASRSKSALG